MTYDWQILTLADIAEPEGGLVDGPFGSNLPASCYVEEGIPVIRGSNLTVGLERFKSNDFVYVSKETLRRLKRSECLPKDIIFTKKGTLGQTGIVPSDSHYERYLLSSNQMRLRVNTDLADPEYVYYWISSKASIEKIKRDSEYTGVPKINLDYLKKFPIVIPKLIVQKQISNILSGFEDKIDLNHQMNSTLEQLAQTLFKHWFIDFEFPDENGNPYKSSGGRMVDSELGGIPEGWKIGVLGDFCEIIMGQSPPGKTYNEEGEGLPFHQGITDFGFRFPSQRVYCTEPKKFAEKDDVLLSVRAPVGSLNVADQKYAIGRGLAALKLKRDHGGYLFYLMKATQSRWNIFESEGTVFGSVGKSDIQNFKTIILPQSLITKFNALIKPFDERIACNEKNNLILSSIRDSLLPKLMSGKIRVQIGNNESDQNIIKC